MIEITKIVARLTADPFGIEPAAYETVLSLIRTAIDRLGWGIMLYRCDTCKFELSVWLSLGVEGPPELRSSGLYVASPFSFKCPAWPEMKVCEGMMSHVDFKKDREFDPRLIPDDSPRFVLPYSLSRGNQGARLEIPEQALVDAHKFHNESVS